MDIYTLLCLKWIADKDPLYSTWSSAQWLPGSLDGRGVRGRMETYVCMAESPHCSSETVTTLFVNQPYSNQPYKIQSKEEKIKAQKKIYYPK